MSRASGTIQETELGRGEGGKEGDAVDKEVSYPERHLGTGDTEHSMKGAEKRQV